MAFSSFPHKFTYQYTLLLAVLSLLGSGYILSSQLHAKLFSSQANGIRLPRSRSPDPPQGLNTRPEYPIFENIPAQGVNQALAPENVQPIDPIPLANELKGNRLSKRAPIGATWRQIRILLSDPDGPGQGWLLPGFSSLFNFISFYEDFVLLYQATGEIQEFVLDWRDVEENVALPRAQNVAAALNDYARAIGDFPRFTINHMRLLVGNLRETSQHGDSWSDPEVMARYLFQVMQDNPLIIDDRWFNMLLNFLQESLLGLRIWIRGILTAATRCDAVVRNFAPQATYLENLDTVREDLGEVMFAFAEMAEIADWAFTNLTNFRLEIDNFVVQDQYEQTLPDTPTYQGFIPGEDYGHDGFEGGVFGNPDILGRVIPQMNEEDEVESLEDENPGRVLISGDIEIEGDLSNMQEEHLQDPVPSPSEN
ncbi:hypothetical protein AA313_de0208148 [Arthrobotrys entomopaga]|nr:hypothetical protein AA313_de0208148 [Arthrobotrys entomopaga]